MTRHSVDPAASGRPEANLQVLLSKQAKDREAFDQMWETQPYPFTAKHWKPVPKVHIILDIVERSGYEVSDAWRGKKKSSDRLLIAIRKKTDRKNLCTEHADPPPQSAFP